MSAKLLVAVLLAPLLFVSCGKPKEASLNEPASVIFESVPHRQRELLANDLKVLGGMPQGEGDSTVLEVEEFSGKGFNHWLSARLKFLVGRDFDYSANLPEPPGSLLLREGMTLASLIQRRGFDDAYAANMGAFLYTIGKNLSQVIYTVTLAGQAIAVTSPRVGITVVSDRLFDGTRGVTFAASDSLSNSYIRLATLFHEARHSDGNGANASFPHTSCRAGYRLNICDAASNGPNAVAAAFLEFAMDHCSNCSEPEKEVIRGVMAEALSRVRPDARPKDITPVSAD